jgi:hypothetical protein
MAFSTVPSPLYGLYRARDHFSVFMVTVIYAVGVIGALLLARRPGHPHDRRRAGRSAQGPPIKGLADVIPDVTPIDRVTTNAWGDIHEAVAARSADVADRWPTDGGLPRPDRCLSDGDGYRVFFVSDCSGGMSVEADEDAKRRLVQGRSDAHQLALANARTGSWLRLSSAQDSSAGAGSVPRSRMLS